MNSGNKYFRLDRYIINGTLKYTGFEKWRVICNGICKATGEERSFFIEFYLINPSVSPKDPVIAQKSQLKHSESDLQYALAGTASALDADAEQEVKPSYVLVKAGMLGAGGKHINQFFPADSLFYSSGDSVIHAGSCMFSEEAITGSVSASVTQIRESPELLCNAGTMDWNLRYERLIIAEPCVQKKHQAWYALGARCIFAGLIHLDGEEYTVIPKSSYGYIDKAWGPSLPQKYYHLSSSNLSSVITGRPLALSSFAVEGEYDGGVKLLLTLEGKTMNILGHTPFDNYSEIHNCLEMPHDEEGEKLHWTASFRKNKVVVDVDVYCKTSEMFVRDYEVPEGGRSLLKVLGGGTGTGEVRVYLKNGKNLEMLEHMHLANTVCEYGTIAEPEK